MTLALVPMKDLGEAKQRLSGVLDQAERMGLVYAMLRDVIAALRTAEHVEEIAIVAHDRGYLDFEVEFLEEAVNEGYNEAVAHALTQPLMADRAAILILPGDVPSVLPEEIDRLASPAMENTVRIAPARDGDGTNGLMLTPPRLLATAFGPASSARHTALAKAAGATVEKIEGPGIGFDIDTPNDLVEFSAVDGNGETHTYLDVSGIRRRLLAEYPHGFTDGEA